MGEVIFGLAALLYITFLIWLFLATSSSDVRRKFYRGVVSVLESVEDEHEASLRLQMIYKRLSENHPRFRQRYRSTTQLLEDLLTDMETLAPKKFKSILEIEPPTQLREKISRILSLLSEKQPFPSVSSKQGNLLNQLTSAIEVNNKDLGFAVLRQLGAEFEVLEGNLQQQERRGQLAVVLSVVGAVLTIFFGVLSFINLK